MTQLTCGGTTAATIPDTCPYLGLLAQQMSARGGPRLAGPARAAAPGDQHAGGLDVDGAGGRHPQGAGGGAVGLSGALQPGHRAEPASAGLVPQPTATGEIRLAVNGTLDPATVTALRVAQSPGTVLLLDLDALADPMATGGFPAVNRQLRRRGHRHQAGCAADGGQAIRHPDHPGREGHRRAGAGAAAAVGAADGAGPAAGRRRRARSPASATSRPRMLEPGRLGLATAAR